MKPRTVLLAALIAVPAAVSCSGDDATGEPTTAAVLETTPSTAASSTSAPLVTAAVPTLGDPATTIETTTTIDAVAQTKAAVAAAIVQARQDYQYALQNYDARRRPRRSGTHDRSRQPVVGAHARKHRDAEDEWMDVTAEPGRSIGHGRRGRGGARSTVRQQRAPKSPCARSTPTCWFEPAGAPDGSDTVVNDEVIARRNRVTLVLENGVWKAYQGLGLGSWTGQATCPAV